MVVTDAAHCGDCAGTADQRSVFVIVCGVCPWRTVGGRIPPWIAFDTLFNTMIDSVDFSILMFMILLGMIVMLMQESGGTRCLR